MAFAGGNLNLTGLRPVSNGVGGTSPRVREYAVSATLAATIGEGCVLGKGTIGVFIYASTSLRHVVGVAAMNMKASPGAGAKILVYDDPNQEYVCVGDTAVSAANAITFVGRYTSLVSNVYNATVAYGKTVIDTSSPVTSAATGEIVQIIRVEPQVGQSDIAAKAQFRVKLDNHYNVYESYSVTRI